MISRGVRRGSRRVVICRNIGRVGFPPLSKNLHLTLDTAHNAVGKHICGIDNCSRSFHRLGTPPLPSPLLSQTSNFDRPNETPSKNSQPSSSTSSSQHQCITLNPPPHHHKYLREPVRVFYPPITDWEGYQRPEMEIRLRQIMP